ncbi:hypothetical protein HCN44_009884 [Aphidius gifuensis]|uniref:Uncharacterized protein n=1 Tax=Aphidius gifuensis TaxID=684658 RepID=A0A835CMU8_APHGI|nr:uncharacterized protein LOC122856595 [Aphidius gifuensis]KAF7990149.1 hypothetical protein HCN44_009884 [Aphidius gifuensis]
MDNLNDPDKITKKKLQKKKAKKLLHDSKPWSVEQKKRLLSAMMKHGCSNYKAIAKEFSEFTKTTVKNMILLMIKKAETEQYSYSIRDWKNVKLYSNKKPIITKALKYISLFEKHPSTDKCAGCDFQALYNCLSNATVGRQVLQSSAMTHETLWHVVDSVKREVLSIENQIEIDQYVSLDIDKIHNDKYLQKTY